MSLMPTALIFSNLSFRSSQDGKSIEPMYRVLPLIFTGVRLVNMDSWRVALSILWSPSFFYFVVVGFCLCRAFSFLGRNVIFKYFVLSACEAGVFLIQAGRNFFYAVSSLHEFYYRKHAARIRSVNRIIGAVSVSINPPPFKWRPGIWTVKAHQSWIEQTMTITQQVAYGRG